MQGLRVVAPTNPGELVALGGGSGNFVQIISAQGLLKFVDNKNEFFYGFAGWQGVVKDFVSLKVSSTVPNDVIVANVGRKVLGKDGLFQEMAQQSLAISTQVQNLFLNNTPGPFEGDGTNLFTRSNEFLGGTVYAQGGDITIQLAATNLDGIQYMLLQAGADLTAGDSGTIQAILHSGAKVNAYLKSVPGNAVVGTIGVTNPNVKILTQGVEALFIPKGNLVGTGGFFTLLSRSGFAAPQMTF